MSKSKPSRLHALFNEQGDNLRIDIVAEKPVQDFINKHANILDSSFQKVPMSDIMRQRLQRSDYIFSGMKTFHELNEAFPSLIDDNGNRKTFERFWNDVQTIDNTYNRNYLRAEYNFCQASADMAAKWEQYAKDGDTVQDGQRRPRAARTRRAAWSDAATIRPFLGSLLSAKRMELQVHCRTGQKKQVPSDAA